MPGEIQLMFELVDAEGPDVVGEVELKRFCVWCFGVSRSFFRLELWCWWERVGTSCFERIDRCVFGAWNFFEILGDLGLRTCFFLCHPYGVNFWLLRQQ